MILVDHPNVLKSHCSFVNGHDLWIVMPYMSGGSCLHILKAAYPDGFEEVVIATVLREVLKGVEYLHNHGHIHRDIKVRIYDLINQLDHVVLSTDVHILVKPPPHPPHSKKKEKEGSVNSYVIIIYLHFLQVLSSVSP